MSEISKQAKWYHVLFLAFIFAGVIVSIPTFAYVIGMALRLGLDTP